MNKIYFSVPFFLFLLMSCRNHDLTDQNSSSGNEDEGSVIKKMTSWMSAGSRKEMGIQEYVKWVENKDNGLKSQRTIDHFLYTVQYQPSQYMVMKDVRDATISQNEMDEKAKEYDPYQFYAFTIKDTTGTDELLKLDIRSSEEYYARIDYFSNGMQRNVFLIDDKDTLPCVMFHFERSFGLAPECRFMLGFNKSKKNKYENSDKVLVYEDNVFGTGIIKIRIDGDQLKKLPLLVMKSGS